MERERELALCALHHNLLHLIRMVGRNDCERRVGIDEADHLNALG